jgi:hypothetical protein
MSGAGPVAGQPHPYSAPQAGVTGEGPAARAGRPVRRHLQNAHFTVHSSFLVLHQVPGDRVVGGQRCRIEIDVGAERV